MTALNHGFAAAARAVPLAAALVLAGCVNLAPELQRPALPVPAQLPAVSADAATVAQPAWQDLLHDQRLRQVVSLALANNRDLRVALLNVERSRAQLRLADADRYPTVSAALLAQRAPNTSGVQTNTFQAGLQVSNYELDLLGRVRNASDAAAANLLATEAARRSARLSLVVQTAAAWLTLAADGEQLALARNSLSSRSESLRLTTLREQVGAASNIELQAAQTLSASARASVAQLERQLAQDQNALNLLVGTPVAPELLPPAQLSNGDWLASVPAGVSSEVLLKRPDVIQAEQLLAAANANIGAARAAMFPRITLSTSAGQVSDSLRTLFDAGHFAWTVAGNAAVAIFDAGRNQANVDAAKVGREIAVAQYDKAVQSAFRDTADALVAQASWQRQLAAQQDLVAAESERTRLTRMRLQAGSLSLLDTLDAERSLDSAQQALVQVRLAELINRLSLYRALGGDEAAKS
jgi:NodT family efflux transporter outer membrane factor (OMF) lipoprotein